MLFTAHDLRDQIRRQIASGPRPIDRSFERFVSGALVSPLAQLRARAASVSQDDKTWTLQIDLPGLSREQVSIKLDGAVVRIETVKEAPRSFSAAYELPLEIDAATSNAKLENGVLTLTLGKKQPVVTTTELPIS